MKTERHRSHGQRQLGNGLGGVLLHGPDRVPRTFARAMADKLTLYIPDRRGLGMSGPCSNLLIRVKLSWNGGVSPLREAPGDPSRSARRLG